MEKSKIGQLLWIISFTNRVNTEKRNTHVPNTHVLFITDLFSNNIRKTDMGQPKQLHDKSWPELTQLAASTSFANPGHIELQSQPT